MYWRISYRAVTVEAGVYLFACLCMCAYLPEYPLMTLAGIVLTGSFIFKTVQSGKKMIGAICYLNFSGVDSCFTSFVFEEEKPAIQLTNVSLLWHCRYCALLRIEADSEGLAVWKQWIYAAETTAHGYSHLLRVLRT